MTADVGSPQMIFTDPQIADEGGRIVGATFVGAEVAEWLQAATIAIVGEVPADRLREVIPVFPPVARSG